MSYLNLGGVTAADFTKTLISFWFRVPQAAIDAAYTASTGDGSPLDGVIPLVVMGEKGSRSTSTRATTRVPYNLNNVYGPIGGTGSSTGPVLTFSDFSGPLAYDYTQTVTVIWTPASTASGTENSYTNVFKTSPGPRIPTSPTFIGIDASRKDGPTLYINFETNKIGTAANYTFEVQSRTPGTSDAVDPQIDDWGSTGERQTVDRYSSFAGFLYNISTIDTVMPAAPPEAYINNGIISLTKGVDNYVDVSNVDLGNTAAITADLITVTPDVWHHVMISLNLQTMATHGGPRSDNFAQFTDSASQLYAALDDKNYTGYDLSNNWTEGDPNDIINNDALLVAGSVPETDEDGNSRGTPTYSISDPTIPLHGNPMGLPATTEFVNDIYLVEMAEFQMFIGLFRDTSDRTVRRYFIDSDGKPVPAAQQSATDSDGNITRTSGSIKGIGRRPDILLHGCQNWVKGRNTGALGMDYSGKTPQIIDSGQFTAIALIRPYKPEPSLNGPQG